MGTRDRIGLILLPVGAHRIEDYNSRMKTAYTFVPSRAHEYPDHPERPGRLELLEPQLKSFAAERIEAAPATLEEVARIHLPEMISEIEMVCKRGPGIIDHAPT